MGAALLVVQHVDLGVLFLRWFRAMVSGSLKIHDLFHTDGLISGCQCEDFLEQ